MKNILILVSGSRQWMGGVYYIRNILFQISLIEKVEEKYQIFLCLDETLISEFTDINERLVIHYIEKNNDPEQILKLCDIYDIDVVFPVQREKYYWIVRDICIYWIPDFQEVYMPQNFSEVELCYRRKINEYVARKHRYLVLSSNDALLDYKKLYPQYTDNLYVIHFTSYIENLIESIDDQLKKKVFEKFSITYQYLYVANQFWKHKNHIVVLRALRRIIENGHKEIHLLCTGYMQSYGEKKDEYVEGLQLYVRQNGLEDNVHFLGLLDRIDQLCLMKNANLIIQPSLFEGWGCSVEDAKVLGKTIVLSDISVHKEQSDESCIFFEKNNDAQLAQIILENFFKNKIFNLENGKKKTYKNALKYSKEFEQVIRTVNNCQKKSYMQILHSKRKKRILELFGDLDLDFIGIYGTGKHTDNLLRSFTQLFGERKLIYFDSDCNKWWKEYHGAIINPPYEILSKGIKRIIISSINYQEEIYRNIKKYEGVIEIIKIYEKADWEFETLW